MFNLKEFVKNYPQCLESEEKLKAHLLDIFPKDKAKINILISIYKSEIFEKIKSPQIVDGIEIERLCIVLEKEFGFSKDISKECILMWIEVFNNVEPTSINSEKNEFSYPTDLLKYHMTDSCLGDEDFKNEIDKLRMVFNTFKVNVEFLEVHRGPLITRFEIKPALGVKISKIKSLSADIALAFGVSKIYIEAPIPNKSAIGIDIPNTVPQIVSLREALESPENLNCKSELAIILGRDSIGNIVLYDLEKNSNILIAGTTGSGKSVCLNSMITNIIYNSKPEHVKFIMINTNAVEFSLYNGIPHLCLPVISDRNKVIGVFNWAITEAQNRCNLFSNKGVRDINSYNKLTETDMSVSFLPHICIFIDELSDFMDNAQNEIDDSLCRLAQISRTVGIHLVVATQRPDSKTISGQIKANFPTRISFLVQSKTDSNIILDESGAENLFGSGDMLLRTIGIPKPLRMQGCYVSEEEIKNVVSFINNNRNNKNYDESIKEFENQIIIMDTKIVSIPESPSGVLDESDEMLSKAIEVVVEAQMASTTLLQRKLKLGYARAARIIDELEQRKIVGPFEGSKPRKVLITKQQLLEINALVNASASIENPIEPNSNYDVFEDDNFLENKREAMHTRKSSVEALSVLDLDENNELIIKAIEVVVEAQMASTTLIQRKLNLKYVSAARIVDELEHRKIVGPFNGSNPRKVLITKQQWLEMNALGNHSTSTATTIDSNSDYNVFEDDNYIEDTTSYADESADRIKQGVCRYCGGTFKGIFIKKCSSCGKPKDY